MSKQTILKAVTAVLRTIVGLIIGLLCGAIGGIVIAVLTTNPAFRFVIFTRTAY